MEWKQIFFQNISTYLDIINNFLSKSYSIEPLGNYVKVQGGYAFKNSEYKTTGIPIIRISDFQNERIILDNTKFYDEKQELSRYELNQGDIIIAMTGGTIGKLAVVQEGLGKIYLNQRVGKFEILDKNKFHKEYVYWIARGVEEKVKKLGYGGAQPNVSNKQIENLQFPFPEKETQKSIVSFLNDFMDNKLTKNIYFDKITEEKIIKLQNITLNIHLDALKESNNSILNLKKLKEAILQEAIQGKLVEQNSNDEPASILLEKIKKEKEQLIKEKKIKKEKSLSEITQDEIPYELPNGWEWVRLGEILNVKSSKRIFASDYVKEGVPFFRSKEIGELGTGKEVYSELYIKRKKYEEIKLDFGIPKEGDILLACIGGSIGNLWLVDDREFYYKDGNLVQIDKNNFLFNLYVLNYLRSNSFYENALGKVSGSAYNALTIIKIKNSLFPLPPLEEQKRIVEKVDILMAFCDELEQEINKSKKQAEQLMQSVLKEAFEEKENL